MGGPIVRSGASPEFSANWDRIFGGQKTKKKSATKGGKPAKKKATSSTKKSKPAAKKKGKKAKKS